MEEKISVNLVMCYVGSDPKGREINVLRVVKDDQLGEERCFLRKGMRLTVGTVYSFLSNDAEGRQVYPISSKALHAWRDAEEVAEWWVRHNELRMRRLAKSKESEIEASTSFDRQRLRDVKNAYQQLPFVGRELFLARLVAYLHGGK